MYEVFDKVIIKWNSFSNFSSHPIEMKLFNKALNKVARNSNFDSQDMIEYIKSKTEFNLNDVNINELNSWENKADTISQFISDNEL